MKRKLLTLILCIAINLYGQMNATAPTTLTEAENLLKTGELDSLRFNQFKELLLNPVHPRREGWRRISELAFESDGQRFPSPEEMATLPDSSAKSLLVIKYPWLLPYAPLFEFETIQVPKRLTGLISGQVTGEPDSTFGDSRFRLVVAGTNNHSSGELTVQSKKGITKLNHRELTLRTSNEKLQLSLGNFQSEKRSLLWGAFRSKIDEVAPEDQLMYGSVSTWNGVYGVGEFGRIKSDILFHRRGLEAVEYGSVSGKIGLVKPEIGIIHTYRTENQMAISFVIADSSGKLRGETIVDTSGGIGFNFTSQIHTKSVHSELEFWALNSFFTSEFSSRYQSLQRRYRDPQSVIGVDTHWSWSGIMTNVESSFSGELCNQGGLSDFSVAVGWPLIWNCSIKNRFVESKNDSVENQFIENSIRIKPALTRTSFPCTINSRFSADGWNHLLVSSGVSYNGKYIKPDATFRYRIIRDQNGECESRLGISSKQESRSSSSLSITIPFTESKGVTVHGQANILF